MLYTATHLCRINFDLAGVYSTTCVITRVPDRCKTGMAELGPISAVGQTPPLQLSFGDTFWWSGKRGSLIEWPAATSPSSQESLQFVTTHTRLTLFFWRRSRERSQHRHCRYPSSRRHVGFKSISPGSELIRTTATEIYLRLFPGPLSNSYEESALSSAESAAPFDLPPLTSQDQPSQQQQQLLRRPHRQLHHQTPHPAIVSPCVSILG